MGNLTIKNFWNASVGTWHPLTEGVTNSCYTIPDNFHKFAESGNSEYYTNDDESVVCRISDHWGSGIRECNWYLEGHPRNNSFIFSKRNKGKRFAGVIEIKKLLDIQNI